MKIYIISTFYYFSYIDNCIAICSMESYLILIISLDDIIVLGA